jgi:GxxExxY protein
MPEILLKDEVYAIVGAAIEVHKEMGSGFLEAIYQEGMELELSDRGIPYTPQELLQVRYKGRLLKKYYLADFICFGSVLVEIKAIEKISGREESQMLNYLKATGLRAGIILNFGKDGLLDWKRMIR